ncbi:MAG: effector-associated constant component EACC1 [Micromonosporaceae bacterium]
MLLACRRFRAATGQRPAHGTVPGPDAVLVAGVSGGQAGLVAGAIVAWIKSRPRRSQR